MFHGIGFKLKSQLPCQFGSGLYPFCIFVGLSAPWVEDGALYSLESDYKDIGKQCGEIAVKVLQGVSAGSISPATPRTVTYSLNLKTAKHMKIKIPKTMIRGARQIF